jgi:hypothetical protein
MVMENEKTLGPTTGMLPPGDREAAKQAFIDLTSKPKRGRPAGSVEYYRDLRMEGAWHRTFIKQLNDMRREGWAYRAVFNLGPIEGVMVLFEKVKKSDDDPIISI